MTSATTAPSATAASDACRDAVGRAQAARKSGDREQALRCFREALAIQPEQSALAVDIAVELRELGRFDEADQHLQTLLTQRPDWFEALAERGRVAHKWRRHAQALGHFDAALGLRPNHDAIGVSRAMSLRELGRLDDAQAQLDAVLALKPQHLNAHVESARVARKRGDHGQALAWFERALAMSPEHANLPVEIAIELRELNRCDEAQGVLNGLLARLPASFEAQLESARLARRRGETELAIQRFRAAQQLREHNESIAVAIAALLRDLGRFDEAEGELATFLQRHPQAFDASLEYARLARRQAQHETALQRFRAALTLRPDHANLPLDIAAELRELGRNDEADAALDGAAESGAAWHQRGVNAQYRDDLDEALRCFAQGMRIEPGHAACYQALAYEQMRLGCFDDAEATIAQARQSIAEPFAFEVLHAKLLRARGLLEPAAERAAQLLQTSPAHPELCSLLLRKLIQTADFAAAEALLGQLPMQTVAQRRLAIQLQVYLARARYDIDQAHRHVRAWLALAPGDASPLQMQALLYLTQGRLREGAVSLNAAQATMQAHGSSRVRGSARKGIQMQLLRELRTNPFAERALQPALDRPLMQRPQAIAAVLDDEPDYAGAAISLMLSLRQLGVLDARAPQANAAVSRIPRHIVQFWDTPQPPQDIVDTTRSWPEHCLGYEHQLFDEAAAEAFMARECAPEVLRAFRSATHPAMRSDLFRLAYLHARGGIYADADDLCRDTIEPWLVAGCELLLLQEDIGSVGNNFIAAVPRHPFIGAALARITQYLIGRQGGSIWFVSGPGAMTRTFCTLYLDSLRQQQLPAGIRFVDFYRAHQCISMHLPRRYKQSDRHWTSPGNQSRPQFNPNAQLRVRRTAAGYAIDVAQAASAGSPALAEPLPKAAEAAAAAPANSGDRLNATQARSTAQIPGLLARLKSWLGHRPW